MASICFSNLLDHMNIFLATTAPSEAKVTYFNLYFTIFPNTVLIDLFHLTCYAALFKINNHAYLSPYIVSEFNFHSAGVGSLEITFTLSIN